MEYNTKELLNALEQVKPFYQKKTTLPILRCVVLRHNNVEYSNLEQSILIEGVNLDEENGHPIVVPFIELYDFVKSSAERYITVQWVDPTIVLVDTARRIKLDGNYDDIKDYPLMDTTKFDEVATCTSSQLVSSLNCVYASSKDDSRFNLNCVYLHTAKNTAVATDGHRLALRPLEIDFRDEIPYLVPRAAVVGLLKILSKAKSSVCIYRHKDKNNLMMITFDDTTLLIRCIDGEYPAYERVVPKVFDIIFTIDQKVVTKSLKSVPITNEHKGITLKGSEGEDVRINTPSFDGIMPTNKILREFEVLINRDYLIEAIKNVPCNGNEISVCNNGNQARGPWILHSYPARTIDLVMPMIP